MPIDIQRLRASSVTCPTSCRASPLSASPSLPANEVGFLVGDRRDRRPYSAAATSTRRSASRPAGLSWPRRSPTTSGPASSPSARAGKLPYQVEAEEYALEYGSATLELHADAIVPGERVLIVDDVLATGGTAGLRLVWWSAWAARSSVPP